MKTIRILIKVLAGILLLAILLVVGGVVLVNSKSFQQRVLKQTTQMLSERLQTQVSIDSVDIRFMAQQLRLYGLHVADHQQRPMLIVRQAGVDADISELLGNKLTIKDVELSGARALLLKPSKDSVANYQFLIDAFKKQPKAKKDTAVMPKKRLEFDIHSVRLNDIQVTYNDMLATLAQTQIKGGKGKYQAEVKLHFATDNHKPRKNAGRPKRGYFDAGHLDVTCGFKAAVDATDNDTLRLSLTDFHALDSVTGIDIRNLQTKVRLLVSCCCLTMCRYSRSAPNCRLTVCACSCLISKIASPSVSIQAPSQAPPICRTSRAPLPPCSVSLRCLSSSVAP